MKIQSTRIVDQGPIRVIVYGKQGYGKTSLARTLPQDDTIILSLENGLRALHGTDIAFVDLTKDENGEPWPAGASATQKFNATVNALKSPEVQKYKHIMLDSLTQFGAILKDYIEENHREECAKNKFFLWAKIGEVTTQLVNYVNDNMKSDIVFLMQESLEKDEENRMFYMPDYQGTAGLKVIMSLFDEIYRLDVDAAGKRTLICQPGPRHRAKSRGSIGPIEEADLGAIFSKIRPNKAVEGEVK